MSEIFNSILTFFSDKGNPILQKVKIGFWVVFILIIIDLISGFSQERLIDNKIENIYQIEEIKNKSNISKPLITYLNTLEQDVIERKSFYSKIRTGIISIGKNVLLPANTKKESTPTEIFWHSIVNLISSSFAWVWALVLTFIGFVKFLLNKQTLRPTNVLNGYSFLIFMSVISTYLTGLIPPLINNQFYTNYLLNFVLHILSIAFCYKLMEYYDNSKNKSSMD